jgi:thymidylate kinase
MQQARKLIVALEGLPGAGKTTAAKALIEELQRLGIRSEMIDIEESGDAPALRAFARKYKHGSKTRILAFWVLRRQQHELAGKSDAEVILMDRYVNSTYAFDRCGNRVPQRILDWVFEDIVEPDLVLYFRVSLSAVRRRKHSHTLDDSAFARRVEAGYEALSRRHGWTAINAAKPPRQVVQQALRHILGKLNKKKNPAQEIALSA